MAKEESRPQQNTSPPKKPGLLWLLLWRLPWHIAGILFASLLLSLLVEYAGLVLWWPEQGAQHARTMMETELRFLSADFTRSLVMSQPSVTVMSWVREGYRWLAENIMPAGTLNNGNSGNLFTQTVAASGTWLAEQLRVFLEATLYITVVFVVRVSILLLSLPLFVMAAAVAMVEGLSLRDLRRYGAGYESSFLYHHARGLIKPSLVYPCMAYLSWPAAAYPNAFLLPSAMLFGMVLTVQASTFKKYL
ncbi:TPA: TIGR03747 family integrating conjugative element membrane protein [Salmonella enterica subsp. enterica serovar Muenchen]|uniref:TIGR03747 family integrating conjugative element membrane protein n=1 Tax=Salmonella enterica TaxID=28901 RepID=A0A403T4M9_SALER|nr:TIGR03747 family integrating conjugative element membrane protein [Salmonella enterica]ECF1925034.1 TIGR03747 family integrating conjugative element membrane protein [Salmonella enterica subsp. enterica serovar Newport]ECJ2364022.1 TIGR03747 family integrating conjugative element membrane protein [Salmonella enterica subsp. diarizonae]EDW2060370.1 TIGR03747 family integrating conjugative element membrane protein [Salmonella enterica subsp. enterica serovar Oslo]HBM0024312.1 TIGR03747 family 